MLRRTGNRHPLTPEQRAEVSALSSHAHVTSHSAVFVYNYGDFRGDPEQLLNDYFDVMLYMANWGSRRLMFRIPGALIDTKQVGLYCISEEIDRRTTRDKKHVIVDLDFQDEDLATWTDGEGWLADLVDLREALIQGDLRTLYLAWLKAGHNALEREDIAQDTIEPPVPAGLGQLSPVLKTLVEFLAVDEAMVAAAAQKSAPRTEESLQLEPWVDKLPVAEQHDFLLRLGRDEPNLSVLLNRRLHELATAQQPQTTTVQTERRTLAALLEAAALWRQQKKEQERRRTERARQQKLADLALRERQVWAQVDALIEEKQAKPYDQAVTLLTDLRDLAIHQGDTDGFAKRVADIARTYANRPALLRRLQKAGLLDD